MTGIEPLTFFALCCASCSVSGNIYRPTEKHLLIPLTQILSLSCNPRRSVTQQPNLPLLRHTHTHTHIYYHVRTCLGRGREGERASLSPPPSSPTLPHNSSLLTSPETIIATLRHLAFNGSGQAGGQGNHRAVNICAHSLHQYEITNREVNERCPNEGSTLVPNGPVSFIFCPYTVSARRTPLLLTPQALLDIPWLMCRTVGGVGAHSHAGKQSSGGCLPGVMVQSSRLE